MIGRRAPRILNRSSLRDFLQTERSTFSAAPILLIESQAAHDRKPSKTVADACQYVRFLLQQQLGFRVVTWSSVASNYAYPTQQDVQNIVDFGARAGVSTVVGVGSGAAMDMAKAAAAFAGKHNDVEQLVMVPATAGATLVSATKNALLLDPIEQTLMISPQNELTIPTATIATPEDGLMDNQELKLNALYTSITIGLDAILRGEDYDADKVSNILNNAILLLGEEATQSEPHKKKEHHELVAETLLSAGAIISYGVNDGTIDSTRSIPIALAASLIPQEFPQYDTITFIASLAPALARIAMEHGRKHNLGLEDEDLLDCIQRVSLKGKAPMLATTTTIEMLMKHIHDNQALWNCNDVASDLFRNLLQDYSLVLQ